MSKTVIGLILLAVGIIGLIGVYSVGMFDLIRASSFASPPRPPSGLYFLKEPFYLILMTIAAVVSLLGGIFLFQGLSRRKE